MDRGGAWDDNISHELEQLFGSEVFDPNRVSLSWEGKREIFLPHIKKIKSKNIKVITVAGTNGKGETSRLLHSHLQKDGKKVGLWTSPHILSVRERFIFDDELISRGDFEKCISSIEVNNLSYYEGLFLYFCHWISTKIDLDVLILEVGLGGRLDSTNYFDADLVCLTSISRDHCEFLGDSLGEILQEKLGVCRDKTPLISGLNSELLNKKISIFSDNHKIPWTNLATQISSFGQKPYWEQNMLVSLCAKNLLLHGDSSVDMEDLPAPQTSPGRFEQMTLKNRRFIFIGAHNLDGLRQLVRSIFLRVEKHENLKTLFAVSNRPDEEVSSMFDLLESCKFIKNDLTLCPFDHSRAMPSKKLLSLVDDREKNSKGRLKFAQDWRTEIHEEISGTTLVLGSYYFIGELQKYLLSNNTCSSK